MTDLEKTPEIIPAGEPLPTTPKTHAEQLLEQGVALRQAGKTAAAVTAYREAAQLPEATAVVFFNLGNALFDLGQMAEAEAAIAECLKREPAMEQALMLAARCAVRLGKEAEARERFAALLRQYPAHFSGWLEAGNLCRQMGLADQAQLSYRQAVAAAPGRWEGLLSLARVLEDTGRNDEAAVAYHQALIVAGQKPGGVRNVHKMMSRYRVERGDSARALESLRQALGIMRVEQPEPDVNDRADLQIDLGEVLMRLGLADLAHRAFERASVATAEHVLSRLAQVSFHNNLWQEAQDVLKRNVELHPESATALWNLAHSYAESWQMAEAEATLGRAEAIAAQPGARSMRASIAGRIGDVDKAREIYRQLGEEEGPTSAMRSSAAMASLYSDTLSAQQVTDLHRELFGDMGANARAAGSFKNDRSAKRRIRLGLISADFHHQHPVNIFMQPVLAHIDHEKFEIFLYHTGIVHDDQTQLAKGRVDHWVAASSMNNAQLARRIEADQIDILLDLSGHTSMNRMALLAERVAPVQVTFLGYPGTTGVPNMDWIITDPVVAPEGSEALFTEQVMRLPNTVFCYAPEVEYPFPAYDKSTAERPLTFGSFNNVPKLTPHTIKLWSAVLSEVPGSRLILKAPSFKDEMAIRTFRERFAAEGVDTDRIEFRGPVGLTDMMAEYADVDIALDPVPYNGGTTTLQALWMGVPVVVKEGANFVSRMGASFMRAAGLSDWVAKNDAEYVKIAAKMAKDRQALLKLKQGLRDRLLDAPGWNIAGYTRDFEKALQAMWAQYCTQGEKSPAKGKRAKGKGV